MTPNPHFAIPLVDDTLLIDNSSLENFTTCPRAAQYYLCQKREKNSERPALMFGGIIHKILEARYKHGPHITRDAERAMLVTAEAAFANYTPAFDDFRNYGTAVNLIAEYNKTYAQESWDILHHDNKPLIEIPFAVPLGELEVNADLTVREADGRITLRHVSTIKVMWQGRIDMVVQREGRIYGLDHKTTSMLGPSYFKEYELASQFHGYTYALEYLLKRKVEGFIINALGVRKPTKTGKAIEFQRATVSYLPSAVAEWQSDTLAIVSDFIEMARRECLPKHTKWCVGKYGLCQFFDVCTLPIEQRQQMLLTGEYKPVTWSPLNNQD